MSQPTSIKKAFYWTLASAIGFGSFSGIMKELMERYPLEEVIFFLMLPIFLFALGLCHLRKSPLIPKGKMSLLWIRALTGFFGWACYFLTIPHIPLPLSSMCYVSMPLFVFLFAPLLIGERFPKKGIPWAAAAILGILLIIEPTPSRLNLSGLSLSYIGLGFLGAFLAGLGQIVNRKMSASLKSETIVLYFALVGILSTFPFVCLNWQSILPSDFWLFIAMGLGGIITQYTFTQAFRFAPASIVCTFGLLDEPFCILMSYLFFQETLDLYQWLGMFVMGIGISALTLLKEDPILSKER